MFMDLIRGTCRLGRACVWNDDGQKVWVTQLKQCLNANHTVNSPENGRMTIVPETGVIKIIMGVGTHQYETSISLKVDELEEMLTYARVKQLRNVNRTEREADKRKRAFRGIKA